MLSNLFVRKKKTIIVTWVLSYLLVLILPIIVNLFTYIESKKTIENEINMSNNLLLHRIQGDIDEVFNAVTKISLYISYNNTIFNELLQENNIKDNYTQFTIHKFVEDLKQYQINVNKTLEYYIYFPELDTVVSSGGSADSMSFYKSMFASTGITYKDWLDGLINGKDNTWKTSERIHDNKTLIIGLEHNRFLPIKENYSKKAIISFFIDKEEVFKDIECKDGSTILLLDKDNSILLFKGSEFEENYFKTVNFDKQYDIQNLTYKNEKIVVSYIFSQTNKWEYVYVIPNNVFLKKSRIISQIVYSSILLCIFISAIIIYKIIKNNYRPISDIITMLKRRMGKNLDKDVNEYLYIQKLISDLVDNREIIETKLNQQQCTVRNSFLSKLMKGRIYLEIDIQQKLNDFKIEFRHQTFIIMLFYIEEYGDVFKGTNNQIELACFVITNVVEELIKEKSECYVIESDNLLACIVDINSENEPNYKEDLINILEKAKEFIYDNFDISFTVSISRPHKLISGISEAYKESMQIMEYRRIVGIGEIIQNDDIQLDDNGNLYYYPLSIEQELIDYIKNGSVNKAKSILEEVFKTNFKDNNMSIYMVHCLMFNIISTIIKTINEVDQEYLKEYFYKHDHIQELLSCNTIYDMQDKVMNILDIVCSYITEKNKSNSFGLLDKVRDFILRNYQDTDLNVSMIGENFHMTSAYISKLFKSQTGIKLLDYVNEVRINKAKRLLMQEKELTLDEISLKVGYNNTRTFLRVFKKITGVTPRQYQDN